MLQSGIGFKKEELMGKTVEELRKICKENGISCYENRKRLAKGPMIEKMIAVDITRCEGYQDDEDTKEWLDDKEYEPELVSDEKAAKLEAERLENKKRYVEQAKIGAIVAFKLSNGKVISAAITKKSTKGRKFMVETKYGAEHKISFDDVLWVRTNKRWPKGIYLLFKQNIKEEVIEDGKEIG